MTEEEKELASNRHRESQEKLDTLLKEMKDYDAAIKEMFAQELDPVKKQLKAQEGAIAWLRGSKQTFDFGDVLRDVNQRHETLVMRMETALSAVPEKYTDRMNSDIQELKRMMSENRIPNEKMDKLMKSVNIQLKQAKTDMGGYRNEIKQLLAEAKTQEEQNRIMMKGFFDEYKNISAQSLEESKSRIEAEAKFRELTTERKIREEQRAFEEAIRGQFEREFEGLREWSLQSHQNLTEVKNALDRRTQELNAAVQSFQSTKQLQDSAYQQLANRLSIKEQELKRSAEQLNAAVGEEKAKLRESHQLLAQEYARTKEEFENQAVPIEIETTEGNAVAPYPSIFKELSLKYPENETFREQTIAFEGLVGAFENAIRKIKSSGVDVPPTYRNALLVPYLETHRQFVTQSSSISNDDYQKIIEDATGFKHEELQDPKTWENFSKSLLNLSYHSELIPEERSIFQSLAKLADQTKSYQIHLPKVDPFQNVSTYPMSPTQADQVAETLINQVTEVPEEKEEEGKSPSQIEMEEYANKFRNEGKSAKYPTMDQYKKRYQDFFDSNPGKSQKWEASTILLETVANRLLSGELDKSETKKALDLLRSKEIAKNYFHDNEDYNDWYTHTRNVYRDIKTKLKSRGKTPSTDDIREMTRFFTHQK